MNPAKPVCVCVCVAEAHTNREEQGCVRVDSCSWKKGSAHNVVDVDPDKKVDSWSDVPHSGQAWFQVFTFSILPPLYPTPCCYLAALLHTATSLLWDRLMVGCASLWPGLNPGRELPEGIQISPRHYPAPQQHLSTLLILTPLYPTPHVHLSTLL